MGINIAICELEAENALCRTMKTDLKRILVDDISGFEDVSASETTVSIDIAKTLFPDWEGFLKRNRIPEDIDAIYLDKVKKDEDIAILQPKSKRVLTGWVSVDDLDKERLNKAISASKKENRLTGWDMITFDEMNETCSSCSLSWDKGRGCIGAFGPEDSLLPGIAAKYSCKLVASVPESAAKKRMFTPAEATQMIDEIQILTDALPKEGKMFVRRYSGSLERMMAVANISVKEKCGFFFF